MKYLWLFHLYADKCTGIINGKNKQSVLDIMGNVWDTKPRFNIGCMRNRNISIVNTLL